MRVLHLNVHMWTDADGRWNGDDVASLIEREDPDLVSLVEVDEPWGSVRTLSGVAERGGYCWVFVPAFEYRSEGGFGNALLSKIPFSSVEQWELLPPTLYDGSEPSEPRVLAMASVTTPSGVIRLGSTHLPRSDPGMRAAASERLSELLGRLETPWLVCGDFNQAPSDWVPPGTRVAPDPVAPTYPASDPVEPIDYILHSGIDLTAQVAASTASDHLPIIGTVSNWSHVEEHTLDR